MPFKPTLFAAAFVFFMPAVAQDEEETAHGETGHVDYSELERVVVRALPFARERLDSAQPIDVMAGERLDDRRGATLGETLMREPGLHATAYGAGASRPVIRGLGGPRVRVLEDSIPAVDASAQSDDHAISVEPLLVDRIEILRGPATLLYGSGAVGGVVNVIDNRIPEQVPMAPLEGRFELRGDTVADERAGVLRLDGGAGIWAWHIDGAWRDADDYRIPGEAVLEDDHGDDHDEDDEPGEDSGRLDNSFVESQSMSAGLSWIGERGFIGVSFKRFDSEYGIPAPHEHGEVEVEGHDEALRSRLTGVGRTRLLEDDHDEEEEEEVFIDLEQTRWDLKGRLRDPLPGFVAATLRMSHNDYIHSEIEREAEPAVHGHEAVLMDDEDEHEHESTVFDVDAFHSRLELEHRAVAGWRGALGIQFEDESLTAQGEEAFVPSGETRAHAVFVLEEKETGDLTWTLGARAERNRVRVDAQDHEHEDDHAGEEEPEQDGPLRRSFNAYSASAGALWRMSEQWQASLNYSRAQRAPSQSELFADGPHAATFTFEQGDPDLSKETTNGFDLIVHRHSRSFDFEISLFYNDISDFVFLDETDQTRLGMPVRTTRQNDAKFYGGEIRGTWQLHDTSAGDFDLRVGHDWVRASLDRGGRLPRISPRRLSAGVDWHRGNARASLDFQHVSRQDRTADNETETAGYDMIDLGLGYRLPLRHGELELFVRASNLLDEEARVHTSFLKSFAPLPGRNYRVGIRGRF